MSDNIGLDYSGWHGHREIELKPGVDVTSFLHVDTPIRYLDFDIFIEKQDTNTATKILFRNVPLNLPDEELIHLCLFYGQPVDGVKREKLNNSNDKGKVGSNRTVELVLNDAACFENYYWLEGPLPLDQGRRITVTHQNQPQQCSNCFGFAKPKYGESEERRCPANGNGRACKELGTERMKMGPYMKDLERFIGYKSLKAKFSRVGSGYQDVSFPGLTLYRQPAK